MPTPKKTSVPKKTPAPKRGAAKKAPVAKATEPTSQEVQAPIPVDTKVDLAGVEPGLRAEAPKPKVINLKCRNTPCPSMQAYVMSDEGRIRRYYCVKCNYVMGVDVGSAVHF